MKIEIKCDNCKKEFERFFCEINKYKNHFCSQKCHGQWKHKNRIEEKVNCLNCKKEFLRVPDKIKRYKHHFCSPGCQRLWRRKRSVVKCSFCGKNFETIFYFIKRNKKHFCDLRCLKAYEKFLRKKVYCSDCGKLLWRIAFKIKTHNNHFCNQKCHMHWQKKNCPKGEKSPYFKKKRVRCLSCGQELWKHQYSIKKQKRFFCNHYCCALWVKKNLSGKNSFNFKKKKIKCTSCKKEFWIHPYRLKKPSKHFCNIKCRSAYSFGKNSSGWKGGRSFEPYTSEFNNSLRDLIRRRDNYKCQFCGAPQEEFTRKLHIHHIDYNKKNNGKENLITLCIFCHRKTNDKRDYWINFFKELFQLKEISVYG
jgi:hypothetical protein